MTPALYLSAIYIYPIKSLGGIRLDQAVVEERGLQHDRRWMLVDAKGDFLTQRQHAHMALLQVSLLPEGLEVRHKQDKVAPLFIPFATENASGEELQVSIWDDTVMAQEVSPAISAWFTAALGMPARLVRMPQHTRRPVDPQYATNGEVVSFADGYPFLIIGQASLDDLNSRLEQPIPMDQFRPNLVFVGGEAFAEDIWSDFTIGSLSFRAVKPCARCVLITINQSTAEKSVEPLRTLATYRQQRNKIMFGQNLLSQSTGILRVGEPVHVLSRA
ncbi:MOSC domain-containing protein [Pontibacter sp. E15-1]|uniref:MOSC domain-containing protein n=1 Tax=Pontibacter sp. E15-1 TaxID=2919918 RepID=UPI001F4FC373|nr:MOSC N-terminal beta barrel domain-containing protein [Pontibacter sp. E15-1]MCJ8166974.1 MOSC domain-containing protein [Pontibacter sp. E15-1]